MKLRTFTPIIATALALLGGCAATIDQDGLEQRTAQSIGRPVGQFTITDRKEENAGRINYTVLTKDGGTYSCYLYGATGFQKAMTFRQTPHSDAICTAMVSSANSKPPVMTSPSAPAPARATSKECNALLRAAGKC